MRRRLDRWRPGTRRLGVVIVAGDSMSPSLRPRDCLLLALGARVRPGHIVAAWHPSQPELMIVKRLAWREDGGWWLVSDNPAAPGASDSFAFGPITEGAVVGRVVARYRPLRRLRWFGAIRPQR